MIIDYFLKNLDYEIMANELGTRADFARAIGIKPTTLNNWFSKKILPNTKTIEEISLFFKKPASYFFNDPVLNNGLVPVNEKDLNWFLHKIANEKLSESERRDFLGQGAEGYTRILVRNFEIDDHIEFPEWFLKLNGIVNQYTEKSLSKNLMQKLKDYNLGDDKAEDKKGSGS